jgi:hypothetical protein
MILLADDGVAAMRCLHVVRDPFELGRAQIEDVDEVGDTTSPAERTDALRFIDKQYIVYR